MGKRELLIAAAFIVLGVGMYHLTAPPGEPSDNGFSVGRLIDDIRREIRGRPAHAETTFTATRDVPDTVSEIRLDFRVGAVTIVGEDRTDIEAEMYVRSNGYDVAEAEKLAKASHLVFDEAGALLIVTGKFPVEGQQTPRLRLKVPARLGVRMDDKNSELNVSNVASVLIGGGRARTTIEKVEGAVSVTQRGSEVTINDVGSLKLTTTTAIEGRISRVREGTVLSLQGGELHAEDLGGTLEVEARNAEMQFDKLDHLERVRINAASGEVVLNGLEAEARIDGQRTEIRIDHLGGAPLTVYNDGEETIEITVPPVGFTMDARVVDGQLSVDEKLETLGLTKDVTPPADGERAGAPEEARLTGKVRGGGPQITLRAKRGDIIVRAR